MRERMGMGRKGMSFLEDGREWRSPDLLYADESEEDLRAMVGMFAVLKQTFPPYEKVRVR